MSLLFAFILTLFLSFYLGHVVKPHILIFPRSLTLILLQSMIVSILFLFFLLILQRPFFSAVATLITLMVIIAVNNAKYKALQEPLVFSDLVLFSQAFKYPRLYFPFLSPIILIAVPLAIVIALYAGFTLETPLSSLFSVSSLIIISLAISLIILMAGISCKIAISSDFEDDFKHFGLINSLIIYTMQAYSKTYKQQLSDKIKAHTTFKQSSASVPHTKELANIIVIQSESFFDPRAMTKLIRPELLKHYDNICQEAPYSGRLTTSAWGANTMRPEFSFLTGLANADLGLARFYPYHTLFHYDLPSITQHLKQLGYQCICIHPNHSGFFGRDRFFKKLGFDRFIDIDDFEAKDTFGPYISDDALRRKIEETLDRQNKATFIFAISMENHGPLHLESIDTEEEKSVYTQKSEKELHDLSIYLRHLANADKMIKDLKTYLAQQDKEQIVCFYGDHIPSMPSIYKQFQYSDERSDYFIWSNKAQAKSKNVNLDLHTEALSSLLLTLAGLNESITQKSEKG